MSSNQQQYEVTQINPDLISLYRWVITETNETFTLSADIPQDFDSNSIHIFFNKEKNMIRINFPGKDLPFFAGTFYQSVNSYSKSIIKKDDILVFEVVFSKSKPEQWPLYINGFGESPIDIDPFSAFILGNHLMEEAARINMEDPDPEKTQTGLGLIQLGVMACFPPALSFMAQLSISMQDFEHALPLLTIGSEIYDDSQCQMLYGMILYQQEANFDASLLNLTKAVSHGLKDAYIALGEFYSPLYPPHHHLEDPKKGFENLIKAYDETKSPFAAIHLSDHYLHGIGCTKDPAKAKEFETIAKRENPELEIISDEEVNFQLAESNKHKNDTPLPQVSEIGSKYEAERKAKKEKSKNIAKVLAGAGTAALVGAAGTLLYNYIKRH